MATRRGGSAPRSVCRVFSMLTEAYVRSSHARRSTNRVQVLFWEDQDVVRDNEKKFATYSFFFQPWSHQTSGMHQFVIWAALEAEGLGANLQHYHYIQEVEDNARKMFDVPESWNMISQMVFGDRQDDAPVQNKEKLPTSQTVKVFGA